MKGEWRPDNNEKMLIDYTVTDNLDDLSVLDYVLLWLSDMSKADKNEDSNQRYEHRLGIGQKINDDEIIELITSLEDKGYVIESIFVDDDFIQFIVESKEGKCYNIVIRVDGSKIMKELGDHSIGKEKLSFSERRFEGVGVEKQLSRNEKKWMGIGDKENLSRNEKKWMGIGDKQKLSKNEKKWLGVKEDAPDANTELVKHDKSAEDIKPDVKQFKEKENESIEYSSDITDYVRSQAELDIYKNAGLTEIEINGRKCLVRDDIEWDKPVDDFGMTNAELVKEGYAPFDSEGRRIELHHIGQKDDSPLAELTFKEHRSSETYSILHDTSKESEIDRAEFNNERKEHWKDIYEYNNGGDKK